MKNNVKKEPLVSVIIPVYNVENYVSRCLDSIIKNTYSNLEIICIDDGSTDRSGEICDQFAQKDFRIFVIHKENGGISSARNAGLRIAKGDYISFIDSDDWIHRSFFAILIDEIEKSQTEIVMCDYLLVKDGDILIEEIPEFETSVIGIKDMMSWRNTKHYVWRRIYSRSILNGIIFDETMVIEDALYNVMVFAKHPDATVTYIPLKLFAYYQREGSLISFIDEEKQLELVRRTNSITKNIDNESRGFLASESIKRLLSSRYLSSLRDKRKTVNECNSLLKETIKMINEPKRKLKYYTLMKSPFLYRIFRLIDDPSLRQYEKKIKQS